MENKELIETTIETLKTRVWDYLLSTESIRVEFDVEGVKDTLFSNLSFGDIRKDGDKILEVVEVDNKSVLCSVRKHSFVFDDELNTDVYLNMFANAIIFKLVIYSVINWETVTEDTKLDGAAATVLNKAGINTVGELVSDLQFESVNDLRDKMSEISIYNTENLYIGNMGAEANVKLSVNAGITYYKPFIANTGKIYDFIKGDIESFIEFIKENIRMKDNKFGIVKGDMNYFPVAVLDEEKVECTDICGDWYTDTLEHFSAVADKAALSVHYDLMTLYGAEKLQDKSFGIFKIKTVEPIIL